MKLPKINCPKCNKEVIENEFIEIKQTSSFKDCIRICNNCGIGFSNSKSNPTLIYKEYFHNVPQELTDGLDYVLNNSINHVNRENKRSKFSFETSEDALTWSFFRYFVIKNKLPELLKLLDIESNDEFFDIYLWGVNITEFENTQLRKDLEKASDFFKENKLRRTEPDVILKLKDKIVIIEVKYRSSNEVINIIEKFNKYNTGNIYADLEKVKSSGHYELFRNWVFASNLSKEKDFILINLAPKKVFQDKNRCKLKSFEESLDQSKGNFLKISWENILKKIKQDSYDTWFIEYLNNKFKI